MDAIDRVKEWTKDMNNYQAKTGLDVFGVSAKSGLNVMVI